MGNPKEVPNIKDLVRSSHADVVFFFFLFETLVHANKIEELKRKINFHGCFAVDRDGRRGGVTGLWKENFNCRITSYSLNYIDMEVIDDIKGVWRLTGFYGFSERDRRRDSWRLLRHLSSMSPIPWCIIGDFNYLLSIDDKYGRIKHPPCLLDGFRSAISDC